MKRSGEKTFNGRSVVIIGAGVFGAGAAVELRQRGYQVTLISPNGLETSEEAASTDISKLVRITYGSDEEYTEMMEKSLQGWKQWNEEWGKELYHETGVLLLTPNRIKEDPYASSSLEMLRKRGLPADILSTKQILQYYPQWDTRYYKNGIYSRRSGWAESSEVVNQLLSKGKTMNVKIIHAEVEKLQYNANKNHIEGILLKDGRHFVLGTHELVVVAAGAWTRELVPSLRPVLTACGQVVFHFQLPKHLVQNYLGSNFPGYLADTPTTGFYGFPSLEDGVLKIGNHGAGHPLEDISKESIDRKLEEVRDAEERKFKAFIERSWPEIAAAGVPTIYSRMCMYCDSFDGNFIIDWHPTVSNLLVAAGGSGHGFKFAPVIGGIIADRVERKYNRFLHKFAWRSPKKVKGEQTRAGGRTSGVRPNDPAFAKSSL